MTPVPSPKWVRDELRRSSTRSSGAGSRGVCEPRVAGASYRARDRALQLELTTGVTVTVPIRLIPDLRRAAARDIRAVKVLGRGGGLHWERLDVDLSVPALLSSALLTDAD
jgi:hypothetical protein